MIQITWIIISAVGIARIYYFAHHARFSPEEKAFLTSKLAGLEKHHARKFLNQGQWMTGEPGTRLTEQGEPVTHLVYLATGAASVSVDGKQVAVQSAKSFIGEITCLSGDPATATVALTESSRYFCIDAEHLRRFLNGNSEVCHALESSFASDLGKKLVAGARQGHVAPVQRIA